MLNKLCCMYNELYWKISLIIFKLKIRLSGTELNARGICLMNYCKKIANNEWTENDRVDAYEECLENAINTSKKDGYEYTRLTMAQQMYEVLEAMNEAG